MSETSCPTMEEESTSLRQGTWGRAVLLLLVTASACFQTWAELWLFWGDENVAFDHGYLVALIVLWLIWQLRLSVRSLSPIPHLQLLPVVIALSATWLLAEIANVFAVHTAIWPMLAFSALWVALGKQVAVRFAVPLGFLYFAMPFWDLLQAPLQAVTAAMVGLITYLLGIPAALDGSYVTLPTSQLFIAEDCSGAQFLCIALAIGFLAGFIRQDNFGTRLLIMVIAGVLSMVFNWLRVILIILAYLNPDLKTVLDWMGGHLTLGWWVFALDLMIFGLVLLYIPRSPRPFIDSYQPPHKSSAASGNNASLWATVAAIIFLPIVTWALPRLDTYPAHLPDANLWRNIPSHGTVLPDPRWQPHFPGAKWEKRSAMLTPRGTTVEVYGNLFHEQLQGSELISRGSHLFDPTHFTTRTTSILHLHDAHGQPFPVRLDQLTHLSGASWQAMYTYFVDKDPVASDFQVQLATSFRSIYSRSTAGVVAASTPCADDCKAEHDQLEELFILMVDRYRSEAGD